MDNLMNITAIICRVITVVLLAVNIFNEDTSLVIWAIFFLLVAVDIDKKGDK
jgi:hypothetical protein